MLSTTPGFRWFCAIPCCAFTMVAMAETHIVTVGDSFFSPAELTIAEGDTVRWQNAAGGMPHDVTADDFSWKSPTASSFTYERTFNSEGSVPYHCGVHSAPGGSFMNGLLTVQAVDDPFAINAGLNDAWYDPAKPGQGFLFSVFPDLQLFFLAWFTYEVERPDQSITAVLGEPGHRWLTAIGGWEGNTVDLKLELSQGGVFNQADPPVMQDGNYGTLSIEFQDCTSATLTYDIPSASQSGTISLVRVVNDNVALCEALSTGGT